MAAEMDSGGCFFGGVAGAKVAATGYGQSKGTY